LNLSRGKEARLRRDFGQEDFGLCQDNQSTITCEYQVSGTHPYEELPNESSFVIPDMDAVTAAGVYISVRVNLHTVGDA